MCENPEAIEVYRSGKNFALILLAEANGYWYEGYDYACYTGGGGACPGPGEYRKPCLSRQEAINKVLEMLLKMGKTYETWPDREGDTWRKFRAGIQKYIESHSPELLVSMHEPKIGRHGQLKLFFA